MNTESTSAKDGRESWSYEDYLGNDPQALENMKVSNLQRYLALFNSRKNIAYDPKREEWRYEDWAEKDVLGLIDLEKNHREKYFDIFNKRLIK